MAQTEKKIQIKNILKIFSQEYPEAECALIHNSPEQLIIATILSAQCTDEQVNKVTPVLFKRFPKIQDLAKAKTSVVEKIIHSTGFFKNKAKNIIGCAKAITELHGGKVPNDMETLVRLPGVGRKTANVVLGNAYGIPGLVVDTHVKRLSTLMGLMEEQDPVKIEFALRELVPKKDWTMFSHYLIWHGRKICIARRPRCAECTIQKYCAFGRKQLET